MGRRNQWKNNERREEDFARIIESMSIQASEVAKTLDELAPPKLAYEEEVLGFIVGDGNKKVGVVAVTERPTLKVLKEAVEKNVDMLVIHEPLYQTKKSFLVEPGLLTYLPNKQRKEVVEKGGFCVFHYHSQWDDADEGNNTVLARKLGLEVTGRIPYGRVGRIEQTTLKSFAETTKQHLECKHVLVVGEDDLLVSTVAVVAGTGNALTEIMEIAKKKGADVLVSGDIQDSRARFAKELDLAIIDAGDYFTENPGMKHLAELLQEKHPDIKVHLLDPGPPWRVK